MGDQNAAVELRRIQVGSLSVAYRTAGSGRPLVLLHGAFEDSRVWQRLMADLSDEFQAVALDAPGCGGSDDPPTTWTAADYGTHIAETLATLGLLRPTILGLSFGSVCALAVWRERPDAVGALVLVSAYAGWAGSLPPEEVERRLRQTEREMTTPVDQVIEKWLPTLVTPNAPPDAVALITSMMRDFRPSGMRPALHALGPVDLRSVLPTIDVPTLLVYGEHDDRAPAGTVGKDLLARIPGSKLVVIPDAPHMVNLEQPAAFNAAVRQFVRTLE